MKGEKNQLKITQNCLESEDKGIRTVIIISVHILKNNGCIKK